jgi:16S rRNA (guanine527-N7)-methyltransferase
LSIAHNTELLWHSFAQDEKLSTEQRAAFETYAQLLQEWNQKINLTARHDVAEIIADHFQDSLYLRQYSDLSKLLGMADVGSGGGFPGIPLAICYPELPVYLIEVNTKKITYLQMLVDRLALKQVAVCHTDWRTFLRKAEYPIDLFCARASLDVDELLRVFKPSCRYNKSTLVYWASKQWQPTHAQEQFLKKEEEYVIRNKKRKLIFFGLNE